MPLLSAHDARPPRAGPRTASARPSDLPVEYELREELGRGTYGIVYRALKQGAPCAVKVCNPDARVRREIEAQQSYSHENIVRILEAGESWYSMELCEDTLSSIGPGLNEEEKIEVLEGIARALAALAAKGHVHRDLSFGNILRVRDTWALADFGQVSVPDATPLTASDVVLGTLRYRAPEFETDGAKNATPAADVYSLGLITIELFTGHASRHALARLPGAQSLRQLLSRMTTPLKSARPTAADVVSSIDLIRGDLRTARGKAFQAAATAGPLGPSLSEEEHAFFAAWLDVPDDSLDERRCERVRRAFAGETRQFNLASHRLKARQFIEFVPSTQDFDACFRLLPPGLVFLAGATTAEFPSLPVPPVVRSIDDDAPF